MKENEILDDLKARLLKGLNEGTVQLIQNPNEDGLACQIGEYWFYFIGSEDEMMTPIEAFDSYTKEELSAMIAEAIQGLDKTEQDYYKPKTLPVNQAVVLY